MLCYVFPYYFLCPLYLFIFLLIALLFVTRAEGVMEITSLPSRGKGKVHVHFISLDPAYGITLDLMLLV